MTILVTGAAGFVGNNVVRKLVAMNQPVRALVFRRAKAEKRLGALGDLVEIVEGDVTDREALKRACDGVSAVVHTVAISMEKGGQTYEEINFQGTVNVLDAAEAGGAARFINISQNGAAPDHWSRFLRSKGKAQAYVAKSNIKWTAIRPSAIFGPQDEFFNTFARLVHLTPLIFPLIDGGGAQFQPVSVDDVAEATVRSLHDDGTIGKEFTVGGPEVLTLGEIEKRVIETLGTSRVFVPAPAWLLRPAVSIMQATLPGSPVTTTLLDLLKVPNIVPDNALVNYFNMEPIPFKGEHIAYLRDTSAGQALAKFFQNATVN
jgi:NADH dehydrogenase